MYIDIGGKNKFEEICKSEIGTSDCKLERVFFRISKKASA